MQNFKIFIITVRGNHDRRIFQEHQLALLGLKPEFVDAITPDRVSQEIPFEYWQSWERPLWPTERACFLSHHMLWARIAEACEPALVLEDDVILSKSVSKFLNAMIGLQGIDHLSIETRTRKKFLSREPLITLGVINLHRMFLDRTGAAAYILWPDGAKKLLNQAKRRAALADAMLCQTTNLKSYQAVPALAFQADVSHLFDRASPLPTKSTVSTHIKPKTLEDGMLCFIKYKFRRIVGQMRIGFRYFFNITAGHKVFVKPLD